MHSPLCPAPRGLPQGRVPPGHPGEEAQSGAVPHTAAAPPVPPTHLQPRDALRSLLAPGAGLTLGGKTSRAALMVLGGELPADGRVPPQPFILPGDAAEGHMAGVSPREGGMLAAERGHGEIQVLEWRCCRLSCVPLVMEGFVAAKRGWGGKGRWGAALTISPGAPVMPCCPRAPTSPCEWRRRHSGTGPRVPQGCGMDGSLEGPRLWVQPRTHLVSWATFASRLARQALQEQSGVRPHARCRRHPLPWGHVCSGAPCPHTHSLSTVSRGPWAAGLSCSALQGKSARQENGERHRKENTACRLLTFTPGMPGVPSLPSMPGRPCGKGTPPRGEERRGRSPPAPRAAGSCACCSEGGQRLLPMRGSGRVVLTFSPLGPMSPWGPLMPRPPCSGRERRALFGAPSAWDGAQGGRQHPGSRWDKGLWVTYQLSLLAWIPRRSLRAFPALQERNTALSRGTRGHPPGTAWGHSPAARLHRWSPPSPCSQQDPAERAGGDSSYPSPTRGTPFGGAHPVTPPCPTGTYRLSFGSRHPRVPPLALRPLRKEAKPLSSGTDLAVPVGGEGVPTIRAKADTANQPLLPSRGVQLLIPAGPFPAVGSITATAPNGHRLPHGAVLPLPAPKGSAR